MWKKSIARLLVVSTACVLSLTGVTTAAHAAPFTLPFAGSSGSTEETPTPPLQESLHRFTVAWKFFYPVDPTTDSIRIELADQGCASDVNPTVQDYQPIQQTETLLFSMTDEDGALHFPCQAMSTTATWRIFTTSRLGTDVTTIKFSSLRNNNELEWEQSTASGRSGTVYIDRVATGVVLNVFNLP